MSKSSFKESKTVAPVKAILHAIHLYPSNLVTKAKLSIKRLLLTRMYSLIIAPCSIISSTRSLCSLRANKRFQTTLSGQVSFIFKPA